MKVRAILDYKGIDYRRIDPLAARRRLRQQGTGKVPAIELEGRLVTDSTDIAYLLDDRFPDPPLLPRGQRERALVHAIEDWADESLYFTGLYYRWFEAEGRKPVAEVFGTSLKGRVAYRYYLRLILRQLEGQGTLRKSPEHVAIDLERHLDAVESLLSPGPFLFGDRPYLCDFALWGQLNYLGRTPVGGAAVAGRPLVAAYVERWAERAVRPQ
jgi:glutathione S-transferase